MFDMNGGQYFGWTHILPNASASDFLALLQAKYHHLNTIVTDEFGENGIYILVLFIIFLIMILIIYTKSVYDTLHATDDQETDTDGNLLFVSAESNENNLTNEEENDQPTFKEEAFTANPPSLPDNSDKSDHTNESEIESESEEQGNMSFNKRLKAQFEKDEEISRDLVVASQISNDYLHLSEDYLRMKEIMQYHAQTENENLLRWQQKKESSPEEDSAEPITEEKLSYQPTPQKLSELIPLIINLFGRDVSEPKVVQVILHRNQAQEPIENIIQIVRTVHDFIGLSTSRQFDNLPNKKFLPSPEEALFALSNGDNSPCLELLKELTKYYIDVAAEQKSITQKLTYAQASHFACMSGNIAGLDDIKLAMNSYTLASELSAKNLNAWSRIGDVYTLQGNQEKAMFAYQTVLEYSDDNIYGHQVANAKLHLADYYDKLGIDVKAQPLRQEGSDYYKPYGYENDLTEAENQVVSIIERNGRKNLIDSLAKLLIRD